VISETVKSQDSWEKWENNIGDIAGDCRRAVEILEKTVDEKEVSAFKQHIMEIAESVALAFREVGELSFFENLKMKLEFMRFEYLARKEGVSCKSFGEFLNVSKDERKALEMLARALNINYAI